ncbi:MAG: hypothetical protein A2289_17260 [Deltaproteobacteria bacterium RIFOXYA12_FULL_58_15]|nr:MAG: hypothetical protein A2289_17260 [Deltaproteobacteria bacterium RIFOXYA12_FULL_58_15]OGR13409.1 MAG: hypothetical protein A2341_09240 [Deltaproteobacteria bacterium RIFOXYB12_FULL_58_9]
MNWRRTLLSLHRDIGYLCFGFTVVYSISGIAVNHREDWDYNFSSTHASRVVGLPSDVLGLSANERSEPAAESRTHQAALIAQLTELAGRSHPPRKVFWRSPDRLSLFFGGADSDVVDYLPESGILELQERQPRAVFRQFNFLHLNEGRRWWTWGADIFAVLLLFLAISGVLIVPGRRGLKGRGGILLAVGIAAPLVGLWLLS